MCMKVPPSTGHSSVYFGFATRELALAFRSSQGAPSGSSITGLSQLGPDHEELATEIRGVIVFPDAETLSLHLDEPDQTQYEDLVLVFRDEA